MSDTSRIKNITILNSNFESNKAIKNTINSLNGNLLI